MYLYSVRKYPIGAGVATQSRSTCRTTCDALGLNPCTTKKTKTTSIKLGSLPFLQLLLSIGTALRRIVSDLSHFCRRNCVKPICQQVCASSARQRQLRYQPLFSLIAQVRPGTQRQLRLEECLAFCQDWNLNSLEVTGPGNKLRVTVFRSLKGSVGQNLIKDGH